MKSRLLNRNEMSVHSENGSISKGINQDKYDRSFWIEEDSVSERAQSKIIQSRFQASGIGNSEIVRNQKSESVALDTRQDLGSNTSSRFSLPEKQQVDDVEEKHEKPNLKTRIMKFLKGDEAHSIGYTRPDNFIGQIVQDLGSSNIGFEQSGQERYISGRRRINSKNNSSIPVFNRENIYLIIWELFVCQFTMLYFFLIPLELFFPEIVREHEVPNLYFLCLIGVMALNIIQLHNTSIYVNGELILNRMTILKKRIQNGSFFVDIFCLFIPVIDLNVKLGSIPFFTLLFYLKFTSIKKFDKKFLNIIQLMRRIKATYLLIRLTFRITFLCHVAACLYLKVGTLQYESNQPSWMHKDSFNITQDGFLVQFEWALYWAVTTILTVGYGDITPQAPIEVLVTILCMLFSCIIFAYCINKIWEILQDLSQKEAKFMEVTNAINRYMRDKSVNVKLQRRICAYIQYYYKKQKSRDEELEQGIISKLAPNLREELIYQAHISVFENVSWMKYFSQDFIKTLAFAIEEFNYPEREKIYIMSDDDENELSTQGLYFLKEGMVECFVPFSEKNVSNTISVTTSHENGSSQNNVMKGNNGGNSPYAASNTATGSKNTVLKNKAKETGSKVDKSLKKDIFLKRLGPMQHFGEMSIFLDRPMKFSVMSVDFTTIYKISRKNFIEIIQKFPEDYEIFCEIKEKLEFSEKSQRYQQPKMKCEGCSKHSDWGVIDSHRLEECSELIPYFRIKKELDEENTFVEEMKIKQERELGFKREKRERKTWKTSLLAIQGCARQVISHMDNALDFEGNRSFSSMSMSQDQEYYQDISEQIIMEEIHNENEEQDNNNNMPDLTLRTSIRKSRPFIDRNSLLITSRNLLNKNGKPEDIGAFFPNLSIEEEPAGEAQPKQKSNFQKMKIQALQLHEEEIIEEVDNQEEQNNGVVHHNFQHFPLESEMESPEHAQHANKKGFRKMSSAMYGNDEHHTGGISSKHANTSTSKNHGMASSFSNMSIQMMLQNHLMEVKQTVAEEIAKSKGGHGYASHAFGGINASHATGTGGATGISRKRSRIIENLPEPMSPFIGGGEIGLQVSKQQLSSHEIQTNSNLDGFGIPLHSNNRLESKIKEGINGVEGEGETLEIDRMQKFKLYRKEYNYDVILKKERERTKRQQIMKHRQSRTKHNASIFKSRIAFQKE